MDQARSALLCVAESQFLVASSHPSAAALFVLRLGLSCHGSPENKPPCGAGKGDGSPGAHGLLLTSGAHREGSLDPWKTPNARASGDGRRYSLSHAREELLLCSTYSSYVPSPASLALAGEQAANDESGIVQRVPTGQASCYHLSLATSSTTASYSWPGSFSPVWFASSWLQTAVAGRGSIRGASQSILPKFKPLFLSLQAHCILNLE